MRARVVRAVLPGSGNGGSGGSVRGRATAAPNDADSLANHGVALAEMARSSAQPPRTRAHSADPNHAIAHYNLATDKRAALRRRDRELRACLAPAA
jgi:hypothetical protein